MKHQPWDLNQSWPVGRKWCRFTNAPQNFGGPSPKFVAQKTSNFGLLFPRLRTRHRISPERNVASTMRQTKILVVSVYNVFPTS